MTKNASPRNKTITLTDEEERKFSANVLDLTTSSDKATLDFQSIDNRIINADLFDVVTRLPSAFADLVIIDPPYNLDKDFHGNSFRARSTEEYASYVATSASVSSRLRETARLCLYLLRLEIIISLFC